MRGEVQKMGEGRVPLGHPGSRSMPQMLCQNILAEMESKERCYRPLVCEKSKPVLLKLFTPRLVKV